MDRCEPNGLTVLHAVRYLLVALEGACGFSGGIMKASLARAGSRLGSLRRTCQRSLLPSLSLHIGIGN